ncbi:MAG TPA: cytochrome c biogenesis protein CcdA [Streptosporangiaceae bacterium]|jgi:cytochrome c-type biogenesis protein|nr:cytochrome c biogenesis protein CcdA [Streptosporangiaceae bacterium]
MSGVGQLVTSGPLILALPVAAAAGAVTFLSPCCLPLVPGYLSFVTGMAGASGIPPRPSGPGGYPAVTAAAGGSGVAVAAPPAPSAAAAVAVPAPRRARVVAGTALFVLGFSVVFVAYGAALGGAGHLLTGHARLLTRILGGLTILLGLLFAGAFDRFSFAGRIVRPSARPKAGLAGAPLLGMMFGFGWTPCIGPTLTAVLALSASSGTVARGAVLAFAYALGLGVPFLLVSFGFQVAMRAFSFARRHARLVTRVGGAMLVCVGLLEVTGAWSSFMAWLQVHWVSGYQAPI